MDSRSTYNCIDINVTKKLKLFVYPMKELRVEIANDHNITKVGRCHRVMLQITKDLRIKCKMTKILQRLEIIIAYWIICNAIRENGHNLRCRMVNSYKHLHHQSTKTLDEVHMARPNVKIVW